MKGWLQVTALFAVSFAFGAVMGVLIMRMLD